MLAFRRMLGAVTIGGAVTIQNDERAEHELSNKLLKLWEHQIDSSRVQWCAELQTLSNENFHNLSRSFGGALKRILHDIKDTESNFKISPATYVKKVSHERQQNIFGANIPLQVLFAIKGMEEYRSFSKENTSVFDEYLAAILTKIDADPEAALIAKKLIARNELIDCVFKGEDFKTFTEKFEALKSIDGEFREQDIGGFNLIVAIINNQLFSEKRAYQHSKILDILEFLNSRGEITLEDLVHNYTYMPRDSDCGETQHDSLLDRILHPRSIKKALIDQPRVNKLIGLLLGTVPDDFDFGNYPQLLEFLAIYKNDKCVENAIAKLNTAQIEQLNVCVQNWQKNQTNARLKLSDKFKL